MNVIFFGGSKYVIPIISFLKNNFNLELVITTEKSKNEPFISFCLENNIPYLSINSLSESEINKKISDKKPIFAVLANFRFTIPKDILRLFPKGVVNIHPSYLPKYRGPTPGQTAILNGDKITGVSLIKLDERIDHGEIIAQEEETILEDDTSESLYLRLFKKGTEMLDNILEEYLKEKVKLKKQDDLIASFTKILKKESGYINSSKSISFNLLDRKIRAYFPWPGVWTRLRLSPGGQTKIVKFLPFKQIQVEGRKKMSYKDFANGYPEGKNILNKFNLI